MCETQLSSRAIQRCDLLFFPIRVYNEPDSASIETVNGSVGRYIDVNIDISIFLKYQQHRCILKGTSMFFRYFLAIISNSSIEIS